MASGFSDLAPEAAGTTTLPAPTLGSLEVSGDDITANYTRGDNSTDGDVAIEVSTDGGSTWSVAGTTNDLQATSVAAVDLLDETTYDVRVVRRTDHATAASGTLAATTEPFTGINVAARSVSFGWEDPDGFTQDGYRIERRQVGVTNFEEIADVGPSTGAYTDSGLIPGTEYEYRVTAYTTGGSTEVAGQGSFTTLGGEANPTVTSTGWSVSVTHPTSGRVIRPDVINPRQVQYLPGPNMMPRIRLPVRRAPSWLESEFDNNPTMSVYLDGEELPIGELVDVELEEGQTVLVGEGGAELRSVVDVEYDAERRPVAATDLVDANTTYATVDNSPAPTQESDVVQSPSGESELGQYVSLSSDDPLEFVGGGLKPQQTNWIAEAESFASPIGSGASNATEFSDGTYVIFTDETGSGGTLNFTVGHDIPAGELEIWYRNDGGDTGGGGPGPVDWSLDGSSIGQTNTVQALGWNEVFADNLQSVSAPALSAGSHSVSFSAGGVSGDWGGNRKIDLVAPLDSLKRFTGGSDATSAYTFDNTVHQDNGYLDRPSEYPVKDVEFDAYESAFSIVGGNASVTINDTTGSQALALSNDRGATYPISNSNTSTVSGSFANPGATLTLKATLSRYSPQGTRNQTPREGYDAQRLDAYELTADLELESLIIEESYDDTLNTVLNDILGTRYAWTYSIESGTPTITVDEPGNSVASRDPEISESQITKKVQTFSKVTVKGSNLPREETFQGSTSFVNLAEDDIVTGSEAVTDGNGTQFTRSVDYEISYSPGEIKILSGGDMSTGTEYNIRYQYGISGTHTVPSATGDTLVRTIPGVTSDRQAEQIAYVLAEVYPAVSTPRYEGEIVVPRLDAAFDPLEGLQLEDMDLPDVARPLSIRGEPELSPLGLTLRLGSAPSLEESLRAISEQVSAVSDRV